MTDRIDHEERASGGRYRIAAAGGEAELTYRVSADGVVVIDHTFVPREARGGKLALALVERAVADAKAKGRKVDPRCAYAARVFDRRPEWRDVRA